MWENYNCWSCRGDKFQSHVIIVPILRADQGQAMHGRTHDQQWQHWIESDFFLQFVVMVWTLQRVQLSLSYEHQHVSDKKGIQPGSSNIETDPCFTSLFSPWYAPRIRARWRLCQVPIFSCLHILSQTQPHFPFASSICGWFHINHFWSFADQN